MGREQVPPEENVPALELVKVTVPPGRMAVPPEASATVAVQVEAEFTGTEDGEQVRLVEVVRLLAVRLQSPSFPPWRSSQPVAVSRFAASDPAEGVKSTEQAFVPVAGRVQVPPEEKVPVPPEKVMVPPGRMPVPESLSETVAVQVEGEFTGTEDGEHDSEVDVLRWVALRLKAPFDPLWSVSPA